MYSLAGGGVSRAIFWEREAEPEAQQGEGCGHLEIVEAEGTAGRNLQREHEMLLGLPKYHRNRSSFVFMNVYIRELLRVPWIGSTPTVVIIRTLASRQQGVR